MKRRNLLGGAGAAALLAACGKESPEAGGKTAPQPVSIERIAAEAKGFSVGSVMSTRVFYVFFDPQCPHCAVLWDNAKALKSQARFVWIPVALMGDKSTAQGAAILAAPDPVARMEENEASVRTQQGGISAMGAPDAQKDIVKRNTDLMNSFGFGGVPTVVGKHAQTGALVTIEGSVATLTLAQKLGLTAPGG